MLEPGAATSMTPRPRLEKLDSRLSMVPAGYRCSDDTVTTPGSSAGMSWQPLLISRVTGAGLSSGLESSVVLFARSDDELPAAAALTTPFRVDQATARLTASLAAYWSGWSEQ